MPKIRFGPFHFIEGSRTRILNIVCAIAGIKSLVFAFLGYEVQPYFISLAALSVIFGITLLINYFRKLVLAEYFVTIATTLWIVYMAIAFGNEQAFQNYLIIALVAWAIFSTKRVVKVVMIATLIMVAVTLALYQRYYPPLFPSPDIVDFLFAMNVITPLALIAFMCWRFVKDTTDAHDTIEQQKEELAESNKFKDRVFSIIGHDMRSPFNSAKGLVDLLESDMLNGEEQKTVLQELRASIDVSLQTLDNILGWASQSYYGSIMNTKTKTELLNIHAMVEKNISLYNPLAKQKKVSFVNRVQPDATVAGDLEQVAFVLRNLTSNALKFSHEGQHITFFTTTTDNEVIISVKDEGVGMTDEMLSSLFRIATRFSKEGTTKEKGSGLGLIFCKEFVENNRGKLWLESAPGQGTTVYFSLPKAGVGEVVYH